MLHFSPIALLHKYGFWNLFSKSCHEHYRNREKNIEIESERERKTRQLVHILHVRLRAIQILCICERVHLIESISYHITDSTYVFGGFCWLMPDRLSPIPCSFHHYLECEISCSGCSCCCCDFHMIFKDCSVYRKHLICSTWFVWSSRAAISNMGSLEHIAIHNNRKQHWLKYGM